MNKRKFRYNWEKSEWQELFTFCNDVVVIPGTRKPDETLNSYSWPRGLTNEIYN